MEIDMEAIQEAWDALRRVNRCSTCQSDGLVLLLYFSARMVERSGLAISDELLRDQLKQARERAANLLAAIRATLAAADDGEDDPLWFLRDEYSASATPPERG